MKLKAFLKKNATRTLHNLGKRVFVDEQHDAKDEDRSWFLVVGQDSDIGRQITNDRHRMTLEASTMEDEVKREEFIEQQVKELYARTVISWSLDEPVTLEAILEIFVEAPFIYDLVINEHLHRVNFTMAKQK